MRNGKRRLRGRRRDRRLAGRRDLVATAVASLLFSTALSGASVAIPLAMLDAGLSNSDIGVLTGASALTQIATRLVLGRLLRRYPDWVLVALACLVLSLSTSAVVLSSAWLWFAAAQLLQGVGRALFWTGSQTHVVRGSTSSVKSLASVNFTANIGTIVGPIVAGLIAEHDLTLSLATAAVVAATAVVPTMLFDRLPPFDKPPADRPPGRIWRRQGVWAGCWASVSGGAWRALLGSYVPVALVYAGHSSGDVGLLVAVANFASLLGSVLVGRLGWDGLVRLFGVGIVLTGAAMALLGVVAESAALAAAALALSGIGAGGLQTLGLAVAADAVHPSERGEAIAVAGTFRAAAILVAPLTVAGVVAFLPMSAALGVVGLGMAAPVLATRGLRQHLTAAGVIEGRPATS